MSPRPMDLALSCRRAGWGRRLVWASRRTATALCLCLLSLGLFPEASILAAGSGSFSELKDEAVRYYQARKYFQAIQSLEAAIAKATPAEKSDAETLLARCRSAIGVELFNAGESRQAEAAFNAALAHAEDSYAHFGLGFLSFMRLDDEKALNHLGEAARLEPTYGKTQKLLGLLDYRQGRNSSALAKMREACRLDPEDREAKALRDRWDLESQWTGTFKERESGRFLLRVDPDISWQRAEEVAQELEKARRDLAEAFFLGEPRGRAARERHRITIVLFSPQRFHKSTGSYHWVAGLYDGQIKFPVRPDRGDAAAQAELVSAVRHEMAHWAIREVGPECPNWLNEGIAQYFENPGQPSQATGKLREAPGRRVSFKNVPARLWEVDDEELARWTYLEGLAFVEFLAERYQPFRLTLCLKAMTAQGSVEKAFEEAYGESLEGLERTWWRTVEGK